MMGAAVEGRKGGKEEQGPRVVMLRVPSPSSGLQVPVCNLSLVTVRHDDDGDYAWLSISGFSHRPGAVVVQEQYQVQSA